MSDIIQPFVFTYKKESTMEPPVLEFGTYARKPFIVEAVQITEENISVVASLGIGDLREKEDGTPYILVDRRVVPNIHKVYPGWWMTKMGDNIRCYTEKIFEDQFERKEPS